MAPSTGSVLFQEERNRKRGGNRGDKAKECYVGSDDKQP